MAEEANTPLSTVKTVTDRTSNPCSTKPTTNESSQNSGLNSSPLAPSIARLWRPAAQRNLRNQWSKLSSYRKQWASCSSVGRAHATALVNAYLSQRYMPSMELGVLSDMPDIKKKASQKLFKQQEFQRSKLLLAYKDLVTVVIEMGNTSRSMRCFLKRAGSSPLVQFSSSCEDVDDSGDCGGAPVFTFWSISSFETMAEEFVEMFKFELILKRLLVLHLLSISEVPADNVLSWANELYPGEVGDLNICNLYSKDSCEVVSPRLKNWKSEEPPMKCSTQPSHEHLQVYLTTWLAELNIDAHRVDEIFSVIGEEMHCSFS